jgi:uncharacterized protein (TIGR00369 family)
LARARGCFAIFASESGAAGPLPDLVYAEKEIVWDDPAILRAAAARMTGLEFIAAQADGTLPLAPINRTVDYVPVTVERGFVAYRCTPADCHYNPMGGVHGGLAAILIDTAGGAAIQTAQPRGVGATAVTLSVDYFRPITRASGPLRAEGRLVRAGTRIGVADAWVKDEGGRVFARGAVTYLSFPLDGAQA